MSWMTGGGQPIPAGLSYPPHPRLWSSDCVQIMKMSFKCYISKNDDNFLISRHFLLVYNNQSQQMPWMTGGGQPIPAGLSSPPPPPRPRRWSSDCLQIMKMTFKCYISENDENTLLFRHFLQEPVSRNALDDGWGATYPSWFILPLTHDFLSCDWLWIFFNCC